MRGFKQAFKEARVRRGLTQQQVCDSTSIALGTLRRWEQGVNEPDLESLVTISELYGVTVGQLVGADDGPVPSLDPDEQRLLDLYRSTDDRGRLAILSVAESQQGVEGKVPGPLTHAASA